MRAVEMPGSIAVLDDAGARSVAIAKGRRILGTTGLLMDAKRAGLPKFGAATQ
jgi:predicted nucleic acid-binding protein